MDASAVGSSHNAVKPAFKETLNVEARHATPTFPHASSVICYAVVQCEVRHRTVAHNPVSWNVKMWHGLSPPSESRGHESSQYTK